MSPPTPAETVRSEGERKTANSYYPGSPHLKVGSRNTIWTGGFAGNSSNVHAAMMATRVQTPSRRTSVRYCG